jgi:microcystin degradation protein MlrC
MRIAIGGFSIESCTFSPLLSYRKDFDVLRGDDLLQLYTFLSQFSDVRVTPLVRARALPGGPVERSFYEDIKNELLEGLREAGPWDGVFLPLHGAANVMGLDDAEGDLTTAIRAVTGPDCLLAASYDLHGNLSPAAVNNLDIISAYRTAPHVDVIATLERVFTLLVSCLRRRIRPCKSFITVPILLPGERTSTECTPARELYRMIPQVLNDEVMDASILVGYAWADEPRSTASVLALGTDLPAVRNAAAVLAQRFWDVRCEFQFGVPAAPVDACIQTAMSAPERPVVISDSGDNPTAGGAGDVPYVLESLLDLQVPDAIYAGIPDREAVTLCHQAGEGAEVELSLGGKLDPVHGRPLKVRGRVLTTVVLPWSLNLTSGSRVTNRQAVVQVGGVKVIITELRTPFHTLADFQQLSLNPQQCKIVVVKIGYLEPELKQMAGKALLALSPGAVNQDIERLPFNRILRPMYPLDPGMTWNVPQNEFKRCETLS